MKQCRQSYHVNVLESHGFITAKGFSVILFPQLDLRFSDRESVGLTSVFLFSSCMQPGKLQFCPSPTCCWALLVEIILCLADLVGQKPFLTTKLKEHSLSLVLNKLLKLNLTSCDTPVCIYCLSPQMAPRDRRLCVHISSCFC